ncbi:Arc family DNA-binding protein [Stenotrophomonas maltophilia]|uniref:Arc family DNA-binding protein n=1 Tax=Stenotrophomonas maltophilia TaxID=40324 RepID=UPI00244C5C9A|nr:Arc family DNA-binding protein [Stenotrophomonas maltophilia]MDH0072184.1 Arc family DNA-binding protein [Stenotrophomonas maltophilia]MDH0104965.1 Arc family DNA-binding protein [Stenotrophomonas maltophilia]MDH0330567.1 Arc family DNA-binding protein [Stenotrophomonas maltophilia]MDH0632228.1 Arc family DNA-binding protein [Stenotrophomonas maltophilia]MDH0642544.1 Arc family DNA-binding protein [Stenotrophomonas maltophilia]
MSQSEPIKSQLRIPAGLHQRLLDATASSGRSMNAEIIHRLESSFTAAADTDALLKSNLVTFQLAAELTRYNPRALTIVSGLISRLFDDDAIRGRVFDLADGGDQIAAMARDTALNKLPDILRDVQSKMEAIIEEGDNSEGAP